VTACLLHRQAVHHLRLQVRRVLIRTRGHPTIVVAFAVILGQRKVEEVLIVTWSVGVGVEIVVRVALALVAVRERMVEGILPVGRARAAVIGTEAARLVEDAAEAGRRIVRPINVKNRPCRILLSRITRLLVRDLPFLPWNKNRFCRRIFYWTRPVLRSSDLG
jgi:hypothetical protein